MKLTNSKAVLTVKHGFYRNTNWCIAMKKTMNTVLIILVELLKKLFIFASKNQHNYQSYFLAKTL